MLEVEIKALKEELITLRSAVSELTSALLQPVTVAQHDAIAECVGKEAHVKVELADIPSDKAKDEAVTRETLQELCTTIMRDDRSKKDAIKDIIAGYNGATNLRMVDDADLADLFAKLKAV